MPVSDVFVQANIVPGDRWEGALQVVKVLMHYQGCSHKDMSCQTILPASSSVISFIGSSLRNQVTLQKMLDSQFMVQYHLECAVACGFFFFF